MKQYTVRVQAICHFVFINTEQMLNAKDVTNIRFVFEVWNFRRFVAIRFRLQFVHIVRVFKTSLHNSYLLLIIAIPG